MEHGGIKVSVFYPDEEGKNFDMEYYLGVHIPLVQKLLGAAMKTASVDHGLAGGAPGISAPFIAIGHLYFDSIGDFQEAFGPHSDEIMADVPKYTNIKPLIQISKVEL